MGTAISDSSRIAVLEANYEAMDRRAIQHERNDENRFDESEKRNEDRFDRIMDRLGELDDKFTEKLTDLDLKVDSLWDENNQRKGALKLSTFIAHGITAIVSIGGAFGIFRAMK